MGRNVERLSDATSLLDSKNSDRRSCLVRGGAATVTLLKNVVNASSVTICCLPRPFTDYYQEFWTRPMTRAPVALIGASIGSLPNPFITVHPNWSLD